MAVKTILQLGDPFLREKALRVSETRNRRVSEMITDLTDTLAYSRRDTGYGRAIAAPQIGVGLRAILLLLPDSEPWPLLNPVITGRSEETHVVWDLCLSFLSIAVQVRRHTQIRVRYEDLNGRSHELVAGADRDLSELLQHEIDHLDGILTVDRMCDVKTLCTRGEFERRYRFSSPYAVEPASQQTFEREKQ